MTQAKGAAPETFTPGPWETSRDAVPEGYTQVTIYAEADGERVATAFRTEANARLIAAAPTLYEALREALEALDDPDTTRQEQYDAADSARAALAKAEGK